MDLAQALADGKRTNFDGKKSEKRFHNNHAVKEGTQNHPKKGNEGAKENGADHAEHEKEKKIAPRQPMKEHSEKK